MSGCLDGLNCPHIEVDCGEKRNIIASVVAGGLVMYGHLRNVSHVFDVFRTFGLLVPFFKFKARLKTQCVNKPLQIHIKVINLGTP